MKNKIRQLYHESRIGYFFIRPFYLTYEYLIRLIPDKIFVRLMFRIRMGYHINLKKPITLNEKINWLKLNDRTPLHTICSDKFEVRNYVKEKIGSTYLVPLYFHTFNPKDITSENIKRVPCIIKTNHDSGGGSIVRDTISPKWDQMQRNFKRRLRGNHYWTSREWQYKNIKPRIIVEKLLQNSFGEIPFDYKLHCFNGRVKMISVDIGRGTDLHFRNWYSPEWNREPYKWSSPKGSNKYTDPNENDVERPQTLEKMIKLSEILSEPFAYVRVDWYEVEGKLFFGELTFHHDSGLQPILPKSWDKKLGEMLNLSN